MGEKVLEDAAVMNKLRPTNIRTYEEYVKKTYFLSLPESHLEGNKELMWYGTGISPKAREKGVRKRVTPTTNVPGNRQSFLCDD